jgi:hypothetical protein
MLADGLQYVSLLTATTRYVRSSINNLLESHHFARLPHRVIGADLEYWPTNLHKARTKREGQGRHLVATIG